MDLPINVTSGLRRVSGRRAVKIAGACAAAIVLRPRTTRDESAALPSHFAAWKDVVDVQPEEIVRLTVLLRDFTGRTVYHCHIAEHENRGMMGVLEVSAGAGA